MKIKAPSLEAALRKWLRTEFGRHVVFGPLWSSGNQIVKGCHVSLKFYCQGRNRAGVTIAEGEGGTISACLHKMLKGQE